MCAIKATAPPASQSRLHLGGHEGHEPGAWGRQPLEAQWTLGSLGRTWEQGVQPCLPEAQQPWGGPWGRPTAQVSPLETWGSRWSKQGLFSVRLMKDS